LNYLGFLCRRVFPKYVLIIVVTIIKIYLKFSPYRNVA